MAEWQEDNEFQMPERTMLREIEDAMTDIGLHPQAVGMQVFLAPIEDNCIPKPPAPSYMYRIFAISSNDEIRECRYTGMNAKAIFPYFDPWQLRTGISPMALGDRGDTMFFIQEDQAMHWRDIAIVHTGIPRSSDGEPMVPRSYQDAVKARLDKKAAQMKHGRAPAYFPQNYVVAASQLYSNYIRQAQADSRDHTKMLEIDRLARQQWATILPHLPYVAI